MLEKRRGEFLVYDDGYRVRRHSYADVTRAARGFAARLSAAGVAKGDKVVFWGENRPEWIACYWGCQLARRDRRPDRLPVVAGLRQQGPRHRRGAAGPRRRRRADAGRRRVARQPTSGSSPISTGAPTARCPRSPIDRDDITQIIFTSGATAEPKGVVIRHRNVLANIVPVGAEIDKYRKYARPFHPLRFVNLLPLSHMFGQSMATNIPPMVAAR